MKNTKKILTLITLISFTLTVIGGIVPMRAWAAPQGGADIIYAHDMHTAGGGDRRTINTDGSISWNNHDQAIIWGINLGDQLAAMKAEPKTYYIKFLYKNKKYTQNQVQGLWGNSSNGDPLGTCLDPEKLIRYGGLGEEDTIINRAEAGKWACAVIPITVTALTDLNVEQTLRAQVLSENGLITTGQYLYFSDTDTPLNMVYEDDPIEDPNATPETGGTGGLDWPKDKLYPNFPAPASRIDAIYLDKDGIDSTTAQEALLVRVAQGLINKTQPRVATLGKIEGDGSDHNNTIIERFYGYNLNRIEDNNSRDRVMKLIEKYKDEFTGYVKYNATVRSGRNQNITASMAATEASLYGAIPITPDMETTIQAMGLTRVGTDFSNTSAFPVNDYSVYDDPSNNTQRNETRANFYRAANWIYNNLRTATSERPGYSKRLFASNPWTAQCIDLAAAVGAPIIWLEYGVTTSANNHRNLLNNFYQDMNDTFPMTEDQIGPAAIGFWNGEGTGVKGMSMYGITEMPSDNFRNWTLYASSDESIDPPTVPAKPTYDPTKRYVNLVVSDGDNASMLGGASLKWDFWPHHSRTDNGRNGNSISSPVTYTFPPALMDAAPGLVNLYYSQATVNDTFTGGPTGLGYIQPGVASGDWGGDGNQGQTGNNFFGTKSAAGAKFPQYYAQWSNRYFEREGLNSLTVWHTLSGDSTWSNRQTFMSQQYFPTLLGIYSNKNDIGAQGKTDGSVIWEGDKPHKAFGAKQSYYNTTADLTHDYEGYYYPIKNAIEAITDTPVTSGKADFVSYQIIAWSGGRDATSEGGSPFGTRMENLRHFAQDFWGNNRVFLRQDHFFMLMTEAEGKPINNALRAAVTTSGNSNSTNRAKITDGSFGKTHLWTSASSESDQWVTVDFGRRLNVSRYVMKNAELAGFDKTLNTKSYTIEASKDGTEWVKIGERTGNTEAVDYGTFTIPADGAANRYRFIRFNITDAGADGLARVGEIEIYGVNSTDIYFDELEVAMAKYNTIDPTMYTLSSIATLNARYASAVSIRGNINATQSNIDTATRNLLTALDALVPALKGDSNESQTVEIDDVHLTLLSIVGQKTLTAQGKTNADMDSDTVIDATDALAILKKIILG